MSIGKLKTEEYYDIDEQGLVLDSRFGQGVDIPEDQAAFEFDGAQLAFQKVDGRRNPNMPIFPRRATGKFFINGLTQLGYVGSDGESASGAIELVQVDIPRTISGKVVIQAVQRSNYSSLPVVGSNWACEFTDAEVARDFWRDYGSRDFRLSRIREGLGECGLEEEVEVYETGLLKPWFMQKVGDGRLTDRFVSFGDAVLPDRPIMEADRNFTVGGVYKVQELDPLTHQQTGIRVATCLGALRHILPPNPIARHMNDTYATFLQWSDGGFEILSEESNHPKPERLTRSDI